MPRRTVKLTERRKTILEAVKHNPGVEFTLLRDLLGLNGSGVLQHHLYKLEVWGYLKGVRSGRCRRYYSSGHIDPYSDALKRNKAYWEVLEALPGNLKEVTARVGIKTRQAVAYLLMGLANRGLAKAERRGRFVNWSISQPKCGADWRICLKAHSYGDADN